jgi:hypothetical protein
LQKCCSRSSKKEIARAESGCDRRPAVRINPLARFSVEKPPKDAEVADFPGLRRGACGDSVTVGR